MLLRKTFIIWMSIYSVSVSCQVKLKEYYQIRNKIIFTIILDSTKNNFYDESLPGQISLSKRNIILALPFKDEPAIAYTIKRESKYKILPVINPSVSQDDSLLVYNYEPEKIKSGIRDILQNNGCLWIGRNYCISLDVNQCHYTNDGYILEINEIEISLIFRQEIANTLTPLRIENKKPDNIILNDYAALSYSMNASYFDFSDTSGGWINYHKNYCRIKTVKDGIYRIKYEDLLSLGISDIDPATINLYRDGPHYSHLYIGRREPYH